MSDDGVITSPANQTIKDIRALEMRKRRKETGLFMAEGLRTIIEGMELGAQMQNVVYLTTLSARPDIRKVRDYCLSCGGRPLEVTQGVLEKLSHKDNPQSVIGVFKQNFKTLKDVKPGICWVVLEEVRDPGNLGTILRTGDAVGAGGLILVDECVDPFSVEAVRASMGALFTQKIAAVDWASFLAWLRSGEGELLGTSLQATQDYQQPRYRHPVFILVGNEAHGLPEGYEAQCDTLVKIPMLGKADSLNAAVATAVMAYEVINQWRRK